MVVPVGASLVRETHHGRLIGNVTSGLMIGILVSRPLASLPLTLSAGVALMCWMRLRWQGSASLYSGCYRDAGRPPGSHMSR
jgi:hypothetical protein